MGDDANEHGAEKIPTHPRAKPLYVHLAPEPKQLPKLPEKQSCWCACFVMYDIVLHCTVPRRTCGAQGSSSSVCWRDTLRSRWRCEGTGGSVLSR